MTDEKIMQDIRNTFTCPSGEACKSDFQDKRYGKGKRVFTPIAGKNTGDKRCTICKATK